MTESADSPAPFFTKHLEDWSGYWCGRFAFLEHFTKFTHRQKALPSWSDSDVEEFMSSDPVYGPTLRTTREAAKFGLTGSAVGALSTAAFSWKYSKSPHGAVLALGAGAVFGWTFGHEVANHWFQLYRLDTISAQTKFMEWWEKKAGGKS